MRAMGGRGAARDEAGRQRDVVRGARLAIAILLVLLLSTVAGAALVAKRINESARDQYVRDAIPLSILVQDLVIQMLNQQTAVRGYVITTRRASLKPYAVGRRVALRDLQEMQAYFPRHPIVAGLIAEARPKIEALRVFYEAQIALVGQGGEALELARARTVRGTTLFGDFREVAERMLTDVDRFVGAAQAEHDEDYRRLVTYLAALGALALAIGGALLVVVPRRLRSAYGSERRARARVDRLREVQFELTGSLREDAVRALVTRQAVEIFGAHAAAILQVRDDAATAVAATRLRDDDRSRLEDEHDPVGSEVRAIVASAHQRDRRGDPDTLPDPSGGMLVLTSLGGFDDTVESLVLIYASPGSIDEELETIGTFGRQACQALENARLYTREHNIAESLQRTMMPRSLPELDGVRFAARYLPGSTEADVGGDWFDVFARPDGRVCAVVGDVGGKGVQAASKMGQLRSSLRAYGLDAATPAEALRLLGRMSLDDPELFATVAMVIVDPREGVCSYALAGHPPPLVAGPGRPPSFLAEGRGVPLGVGLDVPIEPGELTLQAGELLFLYTDGLVEKPTQPVGTGLERLERAAQLAPAEPEAFVDHVLRELVPEERRTDDVAVLALGMTGVIAAAAPVDEEVVRAAA